MRNLSPSAKTLLFLISYLILVKIVFLLFPTVFPLQDQASAFAWITIAAIAGMGVIGFLLTDRAGFPQIWDAKVSNRQRIVIPCIVGLLYGIETVLRDLPNPEPIHLKLPLSILFYSYGAVLLEIMLRLFTVTLVTWFLYRLVFRRRWQTAAFWIAAVVAAFYEPMPRVQEEMATTPPIAVPKIFVDWATEPLFLANVLSAYLYRKYGFLAPLIMRLSHYLVWHILYGGLLHPAG
jgi:hypothetical protein